MADRFSRSKLFGANRVKATENNFVKFLLFTFCKNGLLLKVKQIMNLFLLALRYRVCRASVHKEPAFRSVQQSTINTG